MCDCSFLLNVLIGLLTGLLSSWMTTEIIDKKKMKQRRLLYGLYLSSSFRNLSNKIVDIANAIPNIDTIEDAKNAYQLKCEIDDLISSYIGTYALKDSEIERLKRIYSVHYYNNIKDKQSILGLPQERKKELDDAAKELKCISCSIDEMAGRFERESTPPRFSR